MKIGITLNEVLRDFISQFAYTYGKYNGIDWDIEKNPITDFNLLNHEFVDFDDEYELKKFLYMEAALEVFGHADQTHANIMAQFNQFLIEFADEENGHEIEIVSREAAMSMPATFFFLSKTVCKAPFVRFVTAYADKWDGVDVLITACPTALEAKPDGKISVKVNSPYNKDVSADYEIDNLVEFLQDAELRDKILNTNSVN
jgi:hypothetical protein